MCVGEEWRVGPVVFEERKGIEEKGGFVDEGRRWDDFGDRGMKTE